MPYGHVGYLGRDPVRVSGLCAAVVESGMATALVDSMNSDGSHCSHGCHTATVYDKMDSAGNLAHISHVYNSW